MEKRIVTEYVAFDGTVFESEEMCANYEEKQGSIISKFNTAMDILDDICEFALECDSCPANEICKKIDDTTPWIDYKIAEE